MVYNYSDISNQHSVDTGYSADGLSGVGTTTSSSATGENLPKSATIGIVIAVVFTICLVCSIFIFLRIRKYRRLKMLQNLNVPGYGLSNTHSKKENVLEGDTFARNASISSKNSDNNKKENILQDSDEFVELSKNQCADILKNLKESKVSLPKGEKVYLRLIKHNTAEEATTHFVPSKQISRGVFDYEPPSRESAMFPKSKKLWEYYQERVSTLSLLFKN